MEGSDSTFRGPQDKQRGARTHLEPQSELREFGKRRAQRGKCTENKTDDQAWNKEPDPSEPSDTDASATKTLAPDAPNAYGTEYEYADESEIDNREGLAHTSRLCVAATSARQTHESAEVAPRNVPPRAKEGVARMRMCRPTFD